MTIYNTKIPYSQTVDTSPYLWFLLCWLLPQWANENSLTIQAAFTSQCHRPQKFCFIIQATTCSCPSLKRQWQASQNLSQVQFSLLLHTLPSKLKGISGVSTRRLLHLPLHISCFCLHPFLPDGKYQTRFRTSWKNSRRKMNKTCS